MEVIAKYVLIRFSALVVQEQTSSIMGIVWPVAQAVTLLELLIMEENSAKNASLIAYNAQAIKSVWNAILPIHSITINVCSKPIQLPSFKAIFLMITSF